MRYAVIGDIHGNRHALEAVLEQIEQVGVDSTLCVGDIVGYGAFPADCLHIVREIADANVAGNHDWAVAGKVDIRYFNADARDAVEWTRANMPKEEVEAVGEAPLTVTLDGLTIVHSTLFAPEEFDYMQTQFDVQLAFRHLETPIAFCGHSHVPVMLLEGSPPECLTVCDLELPSARRAIINVGSVGQPRDLDPRACYAIYDEEERKVWLNRVDYDVHAAADSVREAGLPITNARRLVLGR